MTQEPSHFRFNSEDGEPDAFARYHALYAVGTQVIQTGPRFRARVDAVRLDGLMLFERRLHDVAHERTPLKVRRDGFSHVTLQLVLGGRMRVRHGERAVVAERGDIAVFDLTRPQRTEAERLHQLTVALPRASVEREGAFLDGLHAGVLRGAEAAVLGDVMVSVMRRFRREAVSGAGLGAARLIETALGLALSPHAQDGAPADAGALLDRVRLVAETNLARRDLTPERLARLSGVSRGRLYEVLKPAGGVERFIQAARAARLRRLLQSGARESVAALAYRSGFATPAHANRSFKALYGLAPGRFRAAEPGEGEGRDGSVFAGWVETVN